MNTKHGIRATASDQWWERGGNGGRAEGSKQSCVAENWAGAGGGGRGGGGEEGGAKRHGTVGETMAGTPSHLYVPERGAEGPFEPTLALTISEADPSLSAQENTLGV